MNVALRPVAALSAVERAAMRGLLEAHFSGVSEDGFAADLAGKTHALLLLDGARLVGFSTIAYELVEDAGERLGVIHSGDTIVDPAAWHAGALAPAWIAAVRHIHASADPLWWLLICSGVRTWRFLPVCFRSWVPQPDSGDAVLLARRDRLARRRYGAAFDPTSGIVRLARPQRLRAALQAIPGHLHADPVNAFFFASNPGWRDGDELGCLCRLDDDANLTPTGRRLLRLGRHQAAAWPD